MEINKHYKDTQCNPQDSEDISRAVDTFTHHYSKTSSDFCFFDLCLLHMSTLDMDGYQGLNISPKIIASSKFQSTVYFLLCQ